jgi:hypothetical protein
MGTTDAVSAAACDGQDGRTRDVALLGSAWYPDTAKPKQKQAAFSRADADAAAGDRYAALQPLARNTARWLLYKGIPADALGLPEPPAQATVIFHRDQSLFDFADDIGKTGCKALIFAGRGEDGEIADLVAWTLTPPRLASWYGCCSVLDEHNLYGWRLGEGQSLQIWRTPISWLQARRQGVVIIDRTNAAAALPDAGGPFMAEDDPDAVELRRLLRPPEPMILTPWLVSRKTLRRAA